MRYCLSAGFAPIADCRVMGSILPECPRPGLVLNTSRSPIKTVEFPVITSSFLERVSWNSTRSTSRRLSSRSAIPAGVGRVAAVKNSLIGTSMNSKRLSEERLSKKVALAVFSSDALSSTAYATQEILLILVLAGHERDLPQPADRSGHRSAPRDRGGFV